MSKQPFYVGQEVVCINGRSEYKTGEKYIVGFVDCCPNCKTWKVGCIVHDLKTQKRVCMSCNADIRQQLTSYWMIEAYRFAPIERTRINYVVKEVEVAPEIREKAKETILETTQTN